MVIFFKNMKEGQDQINYVNSIKDEQKKESKKERQKEKPKKEPVQR